MTIGLIELYSKGKEDIFLIGNPEITFFKSIYKKYYNFSQRDILCNFVSKPILGNKTYIKLNENADLINKIYLRVNFKGKIINSKLNFSINKPQDINILKDSPLYIGTQFNQINTNFAQDDNLINNWFPITIGQETNLDNNINAIDNQDYISFTPKRNIRYVKLIDNTYRYYYNRNLTSDTKYKFIFPQNISNQDFSFYLYKGNILTTSNPIQILPDLQGYYNFDDFKTSSFNEVNISYKILYKKNTIYGDVILENKGLFSSSNNINNTREFFNYKINNNLYNIENDDTIYIKLDSQLTNYNFTTDLNSLKIDNTFVYLYNTKYQIDINNNFIIKFFDQNNNQIIILDNILDLINYQYQQLKYTITYEKYNKQTINNNIHTYLKNTFNINGSFNIINLNTDLIKLIKNVSININENIIDTHNYNWLNIYNHFFINNNNQHDLNQKLTLLNFNNYNNYFYIPLRFWFNNFTYNSLPLISLKKSEIIINLQFNDKINLFGNYQFLDNIQINNCNLLCNYIFLDKEQKNFFINNKLEYLIEQVQIKEDILIKSNYNHIENNIQLNLHHPIKFFIWNLPYNQILHTAKFSLNNYNVIDEIDASYFHSVIPLKLNLKNYKTINQINNQIFGTYYIYSFSLNPQEYQPSGSCNFSRINSSILNLKVYNQNISTITNTNCNIYAVNYNLLFIQNGKHQLLF
tara:strand:- start:41 stop:2122 length:2082 start_codon:yes stop_codon:yes gene_type:complete